MDSRDSKGKRMSKAHLRVRDGVAQGNMSHKFARHFQIGKKLFNIVDIRLFA